MSKTKTCLLALLLPLLVPAAVHAQDPQAFTAENLGDACESLVLAMRGVQAISQEDPGAMLCFGYLAGWTQAIDSVELKPYCWPTDRSVRPGDLAELLVAWVEAHPDDAPRLAHHALLSALQEAFPCPEAASEATVEEPG